MQYQLIIQGKTHIVSESAALKASSGKPIPPEGLTVEGQSKNIGDPDHIPQKIIAFIKPIVEIECPGGLAITSGHYSQAKEHLHYETQTPYCRNA